MEQVKLNLELLEDALVTSYRELNIFLLATTKTYTGGQQIPGPTHGMEKINKALHNLSEHVNGRW